MCFRTFGLDGALVDELLWMPDAEMPIGPAYAALLHHAATFDGGGM